MTGAVGPARGRETPRARTLGVSEAPGVSGVRVTGEAPDSGLDGGASEGVPGRIAAPAGPARAGGAGTGRRGRHGPVTDRDQAVEVPAASSRPSSAIEVSRILNFWILPVTVIGNSLV